MKIENADRILLVIDGTEFSTVETALSAATESQNNVLKTMHAKVSSGISKLTIIRNKIDLLREEPTIQQQNGIDVISAFRKI